MARRHRTDCDKAKTDPPKKTYAHTTHTQHVHASCPRWLSSTCTPADCSCSPATGGK